MHILEIPKIKNANIEKDELAQWLMFIDNPNSEEVKKFMEENKFFKQAREELAYMSGDENFQQAVEDRARFLMDQKEREGQSKEEGKKEGNIEVAKKMLELKISIEQISIATGLTKEEIEKL